MVWKYRKLEPSNVRGPCIICEKPQKSTGNGKYQALCSGCDNIRFGITRERRSQKGVLKGYRKYKGPVCVECGFLPRHPCQLDVDHIDADHSNNDPDNLQTLCANCHRLKSYYERYK